ncbi:hypothetical protein NKG94_48860 [Micromonospora sp. M12]
MPEDKPRKHPKPTGVPPPVRPSLTRPTGPRHPPYRGPGRAANVVPKSRWWSRCGPAVAHTADGPLWTCDACGQDWPCPALRATPTDAARRATLIPSSPGSPAGRSGTFAASRADPTRSPSSAVSSGSCRSPTRRPAQSSLRLR